MEDEDITKKKGIYSYVLDKKEKHLNIRAFSNNQKREAYERQKGICPVCNEHFEIEEMEGDHITPWHEGGKTSAENCQMLCKEDNRRKSGKWWMANKAVEAKPNGAPHLHVLQNLENGIRN